MDNIDKLLDMDDKIQLANNKQEYLDQSKRGVEYMAKLTDNVK